MRSVLSRVRRFLFWTLLLLLGVYIGWGRIEVWRLSGAVEAIKARGEPIDYDYFYARQVTAEQKEAASLYARAADLATEAESGQQYRASQIDVDLPSGPILTLADIAASYRADAPAMQLLDRATPMDFTEFGEDNRELYDNQIALQVLGSQACLRADLIVVRSGDGDGAAAALVPCLRLQRTFLRSYGAAAAARLLGSFRIVLRHSSPSDSALATLQNALTVWPDVDDMERALLQERARYISDADAPRRRVGDAVVSTLTQPFLTSLTRRRLASYEEALRVARLPLKEREDAVAATRRAAAATKRGAGALFFGAFFNSPEIYFGLGFNTRVAERAARRVIVALLAVERYRRAHSGAPPVSLATLVPEWLPSVPEDPFVPSQALVYRRDPVGYVIYSVDANRRDDGGAFYGHGAAVTQHVGPQSPRDLGIHVPLKPIK